MHRVWPLIVSRTLLRSSGTPSRTWTDQGLSVNLHPGLWEFLDRVLEPHGSNAWGWECGLGNMILKGRLPIPWAIVMFEKEYPLAEHFVAVRGADGQLPFTSWSVGARWRGPGRPPISVIHALSKEAFAAAASRTPMLEAAWEALKTYDADGHWTYLAPPLTESTVQELSQGSQASDADSSTS